MTNEITEKQYYTVKEFAKLLNVTPQTIRMAIRNKKMIAIKPGGGKTSGLRIPRIELERMALRLFNEENTNIA